MERPLRITALAASNRQGSLNRLLLERVVERLVDAGAEVDVIDLREFPLPIYDADLQERDGIPAEAVALHERFAAVDALVFAVPEYNGGYPALFKNVVDWVSRVDMFVFLPRYVGIVSTTPGKGGGARGIEHLRALFANMFVTTHEGFALPKGDRVLVDDGDVDLAEMERLQDWVDAFAAAAVDRVEAATV